MKRCPECRRDYHDDSLAVCLEDRVATPSRNAEDVDKSVHEGLRFRIVAADHIRTA
ncbi:MAG: hypothetical protein ABI539_04880 [Acidobacteriota bacterium]